MVQGYPFMYLTNPIDITGPHGRFCVRNCPTFNSNGTLQGIDCYGVGGLAGGAGPCAYSIEVDQQGNIARAPTANDVVGYDTYLAADRVCIPKAYVLDNAFAPYVGNYNNFLRQAGLANLILDIQNVLPPSLRTGGGSSSPSLSQSPSRSSSWCCSSAAPAASSGWACS